MTDTCQKIDGLCYSIREATDLLEGRGWEDCPELLDEIADYVAQIRFLMDNDPKAGE